MNKALISVEVPRSDDMDRHIFMLPSFLSAIGPFGIITTSDTSLLVYSGWINIDTCIEDKLREIVRSLERLNIHDATFNYNIYEETGEKGTITQKNIELK